MAGYRLTCSSTADMPASFFEEKNIPFICYHFEMDGRQYPDDLGKSMAFEEFYNRVAAGAMPVTSQINAEEFVRFFEPLLADGFDILHIEMSSGLSGTFSSAMMARDELLQKYPGRRIYLVDSLGASSGFGMLVDKAWEMMDAGKPAEEVYTWLEENKLRLHHWFFSTDLTHYRRGGRITATSAVFGTLLHICPLMNMNIEGKLIPRAKVRGKKNAVVEIVERMKQHAENGKAYSGKCFISHSASPEEARAVADLVASEFPNIKGPIMINSIGTVIGSHTGPGTVALFFWGDMRTL